MYEKFTLTALSEIDGGRMAEAFHQALARLEADMHERPGAKSARGEATVQSHVRNTLIEALDNVPIFQGTVA